MKPTPEEIWNWFDNFSTDYAAGHRDITVLLTELQSLSREQLEVAIEAEEFIWNAIDNDQLPGIDSLTTPMMVLCAMVRSELNRRKKRISKSRAGYVYLLQSPTSAYKIGYTVNPESRLATFGIQLPFEVDYLALIKTPDMIALEKTLHDAFEHKRIRGEWFQLSPEDVEYIMGLAQ